MDYKNTLNLPQTKFPMKADLARREPEFLKFWEDNDIYKQVLANAEGKPKYILHDGPPYANGDIHLGHALNKTLKDIIIKYKMLSGFSSPYVPGWDCHGLPIEHALFKELKMTKHDIPQVEFRKKAHGYAMKYVENQKTQFKRLGVFGKWDDPYLTLSHEYEEAIVRSFNELFKKGYIYRGLKPVNWCYRCETALAEAEVEYEDHVSPSVYVKFKLDEAKGVTQDSYLVIWTTTPWTLLANVAVAVHPQLTYSYIKTSKGNLIVASDLLERSMANMGLKDHQMIKEFQGKDLEGLVYSHPFGIRKGKVVLADYVSKEDGTGLVHIAPGHGAEDYQVGLKYKLDIIMPVDAKGKFDHTAGEFKGLNVYDANKVIAEKLLSIGALLFESKVTHSYPHCWRCKNPIIFRATKQWFLSIDKDGLRDKLIKAIDKEVSWVPPSGKERISAMVKLRPDWCLSRQRYWGVPVPALVCNECKEEFFDAKAIERLVEFTAKEGTDCWYIRDLSDFLSPDLTCPVCGKGKTFSKGTDILDVWFDSGVSSQAVLKKRKELGGVPADLYLEGSDQHRGWFQSSLIPGVCIDGKPPFKTVLTHGFVVDGEGRKMSKSLGNVVSPLQIIKEYGADILRMWVASSDYNEDIRISKEILARLSEAYRKIRNTARFILSNLYDFDPKDKVGYEDLKLIDKWILLRLDMLLSAVNSGYGDFEFHKAYKAIYDFCNEDLSMGYLDMVKGRLYTYKADSLERRSAQTVMYEVITSLTKIISPILTFTAEEVWQNILGHGEGLSSVYLSSWPQADKRWLKDKLKDDPVIGLDSYVIPLRPLVAKELEELRSQGTIGSSFDAQINILTNDPARYTFLASLKSDLCEIFKVSQVQIENNASVKALTIKASNADGKKCERCWNYSTAVGENKIHTQLCDNCLRAIGEK